MPGVLTSSEIDEFRGLVEELAMPDSYAIVRDTPTVDTGGGRTTIEETVGVGACRVRALNGGAERAVAERLEWTMAYAVDLPYSASLTPSDRLLVNGARTFEIGGIVDIGEWSMVRTAICQEQG
jgi:hypothetical protein